MRLGLCSLWLLSFAACQFSPSVGPADSGLTGFRDADTTDGGDAETGARDAVSPDGSDPLDQGLTDAVDPGDTGDQRDTGGPEDSGFGDDVGTSDTGPPEDAGFPDVDAPDTGPPDRGVPDVGQPDLGRPDMGRPDLGAPDLGPPDLGPPDTGFDAGQPDTGVISAFPYQPSNLMLPASSYPPPAQDTVITGNCIINTGPAASVSGACGPNTTLIQENVGGTNIAIWVHDNFTVSRAGNGGTISVTGLYPLLILAHGDAVIEGFIDGAGGVSGLNLPGPGAETYCDPQNAPEVGNGGDGSGGGGFGTEGGRGGRKSGGPRPEGGDVDGNATLIPLRGGCHGRLQSVTSVGGRGGGGIQISAAGEIDVTASAIIDISGGGGQGGNNENRGGGGGGSGGGLLLEADILNIRPGGEILAGGGGGGGGGGNGFGNDGDRGNNQPSPSTVAPGGNGGVNDAGDGGDGAIRNTAAEDGDGSSGNNGSAGGGGGGAGRIRLNAHTLCSVISLPTAPTSSGGQSPCVGF